MRLSEAIRAGAMLKPQGFGSGAIDPSATETCALGAALNAAGIRMEHIYRAFSVIRTEWPIVGTVSDCPECDARKNTLDSIIWHLNDHHCWSRERIADWVELHEPIPAPESTPSDVQVVA